jgi:hypothetical protein
LGVADAVSKCGYRVTLTGGDDASSGRFDACNGVPGGDLATTFYATAEPETPGGTGSLYFWLGTNGAIFEDMVPIPETNGLSMSPGGIPIH